MLTVERGLGDMERLCGWGTHENVSIPAPFLRAAFLRVARAYIQMSGYVQYGLSFEKAFLALQSL